MKIFILIYIAVFLAVSLIMTGVGTNDNPIEAGSVNWGRDLDHALNESGKTGRPVLVLFQEIPGCSGCQSFGSTVLTNPLLVETIENEFVPVLIYNNRDGKDKELLKRFGEPAWNYQVIRFLNAQAQDIIPRKDRVWSTEGVAKRMINALQIQNRPVPKYLQAVAMEFDSENQSVAVFGVPCFWSGEVALGRIDGVITTEAGWIDNHEVTRVVYNRQKISLRKLVNKANKNCSALSVYLPDRDMDKVTGITMDRLDGNYRKAEKSDQKKQLQNLKAIYEVPGITEMQKTKINAFLPLGREQAIQWLSPEQQSALRNAENSWEE
ncbi:MAG: VPGUxxT family thioredoxin-like (seleno)protein, type 2 [Calditrichaceae bacterium]